MGEKHCTREQLAKAWAEGYEAAVDDLKEDPWLGVYTMNPYKEGAPRW